MRYTRDFLSLTFPIINLGKRTRLYFSSSCSRGGKGREVVLGKFNFNFSGEKRPNLLFVRYDDEMGVLFVETVDESR